MKIAIVGSRSLVIDNLKPYLPEGTTEIISGGARGIDTCAKEFAIMNKIKYTEFVPEYNKYGKGAPLKRNLQIIEYADCVLAFWDGISRGTKYIIDRCKQNNKKVIVYKIETANRG